MKRPHEWMKVGCGNVGKYTAKKWLNSVSEILGYKLVTRSSKSDCA